MTPQAPIENRKTSNRPPDTNPRGWWHREPRTTAASDDRQLFSWHHLLFYQGQPFSGTIEEPGQTSRPLSRSIYEHGKRNGWYTRWYHAGSVCECKFYKNGIKHGTHTSWWPSGELKFELRFENGLYHGVCQTWYRDGQAAEYRTYDMGREAGLQRIWHPDGRLFEEYWADSEGWREDPGTQNKTRGRRDPTYPDRIQRLPK